MSAIACKEEKPSWQIVLQKTYKKKQYSVNSYSIWIKKQVASTTKSYPISFASGSKKPLANGMAAPISLRKKMDEETTHIRGMSRLKFGVNAMLWKRRAIY